LITHGGYSYVCDEEKGCILVLDLNLKLVRFIGKGRTGEEPQASIAVAELPSKITLPKQRMRPVGCVVVDQKLFVCDANNCLIWVYDLDGTFLQYWGHPGFKDPSGIAIDGCCRFYVSDKGLHCIHVFDTDGMFLRRFGQHGSKKGEFSFPHGVSVQGGVLFVCDTGNNRIQLINIDHTEPPPQVWKIEKPGLYYPAGAVFLDGELFVCCLNTHTIAVFGCDGAFRRDFATVNSPKGHHVYPRGITKYDGRLYISQDGEVSSYC